MRGLNYAWLAQIEGERDWRPRVRIYVTRAALFYTLSSALDHHIGVVPLALELERGLAHAALLTAPHHSSSENHPLAGIYRRWIFSLRDLIQSHSAESDQAGQRTNLKQELLHQAGDFVASGGFDFSGQAGNPEEAQQRIYAAALVLAMAADPLYGFANRDDWAQFQEQALAGLRAAIARGREFGLTGNDLETPWFQQLFQATGESFAASLRQGLSLPEASVDEEVAPASWKLKNAAAALAEAELTSLSENPRTRGFSTRLRMTCAALLQLQIFTRDDLLSILRRRSSRSSSLKQTASLLGADHIGASELGLQLARLASPINGEGAKKETSGLARLRPPVLERLSGERPSTPPPRRPAAVEDPARRRISPREENLAAGLLEGLKKLQERGEIPPWKGAGSEEPGHIEERVRREGRGRPAPLAP